MQNEAVIPFQPNVPSVNEDQHPPNVIQNTCTHNQLHQAPMMFKGTKFKNCTITLNTLQ